MSGWLEDQLQLLELVHEMVAHVSEREEKRLRIKKLQNLAKRDRQAGGVCFSSSSLLFCLFDCSLSVFYMGSQGQARQRLQDRADREETRAAPLTAPTAQHSTAPSPPSLTCWTC